MHSALRWLVKVKINVKVKVKLKIKVKVKVKVKVSGGVVVKALRYKPAGRGFDSRWCHWNFSVT